jgi:hypothetical protein
MVKAVGEAATLAVSQFNCASGTIVEDKGGNEDVSGCMLGEY